MSSFETSAPADFTFFLSRLYFCLFFYNYCFIWFWIVQDRFSGIVSHNLSHKFDLYFYETTEHLFLSHLVGEVISISFHVVFPGFATLVLQRMLLDLHISRSILHFPTLFAIASLKVTWHHTGWNSTDL